MYLVVTYRRGQDDQKDSDDDSGDAEEEADQAHACTASPGQPDACHKRRDDLYHEDDDGLSSTALLTGTNCNTKCNVGRKEQGGEEL